MMRVDAATGSLGQRETRKAGFELRLILGSSSPHRRAILQKAGLVFQTDSPEMDEQGIGCEDPRERPLLVARAKMEALLARIRQPGIVLAADQIVLYQGRMREKPRDIEEAREWLRTAHQHEHRTVTAVVAANSVTSARAEGVDEASIQFRQLPDPVIEDLLRSGEVMGCAGGFSCEHPLVAPHILEIRGEMESLIGLPMALTRRLLAEVGWSP